MWHGLILSTLLLLSGQYIPAGPVFAHGSPCSGIPTWDFQLVATSLSNGTVTTWTDTVASDVVTVSGSPVAGTSDPTPNGTKTVVFTGSQAGSLASSIGGATPTVISVFAVYKINSNSAKNTLTSFGGSGGAPAYFVNGPSNAPGGLDESAIANISNATATPGTGWIDSGVSYTVGSSGAFYLGGATDRTFSSSTPFTNPIKQVFAGEVGENVSITLVELDIKAGTVTSGQATALHNCMVSLYGAV